MPPGGYQISYQASGTVDPSTPLLTVLVDQGGPTLKQQVDIFGLTPIAIGDRRGYIGAIGSGVRTWDAPNNKMLLMQVDGVVVKLLAVNLSDRSLLAAAKSVRKVPIQDWTRQLGARLTRLRGSIGSSGTPVAETNSALLPSAGEVLERQAKALVCFSKSGVPSKARSDGSLEIGIGEQSESGMSPALARCNAELRPTTPDVPLTDADFAALYANVQKQVACLASHGYLVQGLPSIEEFSRRWQSNDPWIPYRALAEQFPTSGDWSDLQVSCPQFQS
jgi:hypothetical protein